MNRRGEYHISDNNCVTFLNDVADYLRLDVSSFKKIEKYDLDF